MVLNKWILRCVSSPLLILCREFWPIHGTEQMNFKVCLIPTTVLGTRCRILYGRSMASTYTYWRGYHIYKGHSIIMGNTCWRTRCGITRTTTTLTSTQYRHGIIWEEGVLKQRCRITVNSRVSAHGRLKFTGQKHGWAFTRRSHLYIIRTHIHTDHKIVKKRGWALTRRWALTRENTVWVYNTSISCRWQKSVEQYYHVRKTENTLCNLDLEVDYV